jgi:hypothetical protein
MNSNLMNIVLECSTNRDGERRHLCRQLSDPALQNAGKDASAPSNDPPMNSNSMTKTVESSHLRWPFQRYSAAWLPALATNLVGPTCRSARTRGSACLPLGLAILALCLLGGLLTVRGQDPYITFTNYPLNTNASLGATVSFRVYVGSGYTPLTFLWQHEGTNLLAATNFTLVLSNLTIADAGGYTAWITNTIGGFTNSRTAILTVDTQFTKITAEPWSTDRGNCWGGIVGDYDDDGYLDIFISRYRSGRSVLYRNNTNGTFASITNSTFPLPVGDYVFGPCSDFDNDGRADLFVWPGVSSPSLFFYGNGNGTFAQVSLATMNPWAMTAVDYDHDGLLDLYCTSSDSTPNRLYRNLGGRTFQAKTSAQVGDILGIRAFGSAAWADYDDDGWEDVAISDLQTRRCRLYRSTGNGRFVAVTNQITQATINALVANWGDYDNDGRVDLCVGAIGGQSAVYRNLGGGNFERASIGLTIQSNYNGVAWGDYDNDGFLDLFMTAGNAGGNSLFRNNGNGTFTVITTGSIVSDRATSNGSAGSGAGNWFDYDNDGFLDLFVPNGNDAGNALVPDFLYHNNGNSNAWLKVKLVGTTSNREGAGAKVRVQATFAGSSRWQRRDITSGGDAYNGMGPIAHFGLGNATSVTTLRIEWPSGTVQELSNVATNQMLTITEPRRPVLALEATPAGFTGTLKADTNQTYQVHASDDLPAGWTVLTNIVTDATGTAYWSDSGLSPQGRRFYKAVKAP